MAEVIYLQQHRVQRFLQRGAAMVFVAAKHPDVEGLDDMLSQFPHGIIPIRVTNDPRMRPAMHATCFPDALRFEASFGGQSRFVYVPWQAVLRADFETPPPPTGGTHARNVA